MYIFTQITEARKNFDSDSLLSSEITQYINKVNRVIPRNIQDLIYLTQKYNLLNKADIEEIRVSSKGGLKRLSDKFNIPETTLEQIWKSIKEIKSKIKLLPQYQSKMEREMIELGKLAMDDLTIDLDTAAGRNAATKMYMPMVYKIVNQYVGKSSLSKQELISAALEGFTAAMNEWQKKQGDKEVAFKTYASYRVQQQILNDINKHSHSLSGFNDYALKKGWSADAFSIDTMINDEGEVKSDYFGFLGKEDKPSQESDDERWKKIYNLIEDNFKQRDIDVFYRYFGLNGYKREKSKDIAKSLGMSEGNIRNSIINKIIAFLRRDPRANEILQEIQDAYNESLMCELLGMDKETIIETLVNDDIYILLEELNKWLSKDVFVNTLSQALDILNKNDQKYIKDILDNDFEFLDGSFKKHKKVIILFLTGMYPAESMSRKTDVSLLDYMVEIQDAYKKHMK